jgi:cell division inhibitor SulA
MPEYVIEREVPGAGSLTDAQLREISQKSVSVYLAPDEATIQEHAKRVGLPANRVSAVRRLIDPSTAE